mgnify:FL=1
MDIKNGKPLPSGLNRSTMIGSLQACIAGDHRYSSRIEVHLVDGTAYVVRLENGAIGGMDSMYGASPFEVHAHSALEKATPAAVVKAIKATMDSTLKTYGKPSKRFRWVGLGERTGISQALVKEAMASD